MGKRTENELLTPEEVLHRYPGGPKTGVFTNGSCSGNPGPGGWGVIWVKDNQVVKEKSGTDPWTTNNQMELVALIAAYKMLPENSQVTIYSTNLICVNTINKWAAVWEKDDWRRKSGPVKNLKLVQELYTLSKTHTDVTLQWIKAYISHWNEYADTLGSAYLGIGLKKIEKD